MTEAAEDTELQVDTRGQITVPLGGADYVLRPSREALSAIERQLHRSIMVLAGQAINGTLAVEDIAAICVEMMKAHGKADSAAGPSYRNPNPAKIADQVYEASAPMITARLAVLLMGAVTGGYTASGEMKPTM